MWRDNGSSIQAVRMLWKKEIDLIIKIIVIGFMNEKKQTSHVSFPAPKDMGKEIGEQKRYGKQKNFP